MVNPRAIAGKAEEEEECWCVSPWTFRAHGLGGLISYKASATRAEDTGVTLHVGKNTPELQANDLFIEF